MGIEAGDYPLDVGSAEGNQFNKETKPPLMPDEGSMRRLPPQCPEAPNPGMQSVAWHGFHYAGDPGASLLAASYRLYKPVGRPLKLIRAAA